MDISSITGSAAGLAGRSTPAPAASDPAPIQSTSGPPNADSAKIRDILGQYNIHQISPRRVLRSDTAIAGAGGRLRGGPEGSGANPAGARSERHRHRRADRSGGIRARSAAGPTEEGGSAQSHQGYRLPPIDANSFLVPVQHQLALVQKFARCSPRVPAATNRWMPWRDAHWRRAVAHRPRPECPLAAQDLLALVGPFDNVRAELCWAI